ncbi:peptidyl-tRNA hydrolase [Candidatus Micrarchaeota archaeon]|nr:peptidyl-tRNA hydrolase [Candidatus Micrarchaeota archaeon]
MYKQTIVVRADLDMGKGKLAAQCAHASLSGYNKVRKSHLDIAKAWETGGQKKVVLKVNSEKELFEYFQKGKDAGIPCEIIRDAGHTQLEPGTVTCFAAGPWKGEELDRVFGDLKLL